jgi:hypothetical protein
MTIVRGLLLVVTGLGAGAAIAASRSDPAPGPPRETWVTPARTPKDCGWYRTADPKYWSDKQKAEAEKECHVVEEWRSFVTAHQSCSVDKDCAVVPSDCPFGCMNVPVAAVHANAVTAKQTELRKKLDTDCMYKCRPVTQTKCQKGWCVGAW